MIPGSSPGRSLSGLLAEKPTSKTKTPLIFIGVIKLEQAKPQENAKLNFASTLSQVPGVYDGQVDVLENRVEEAFIKTVKRVLGTGKAGKITVSLAFSRVDDTRIEIKGEVKTALPEPKVGTREVYHDNRGNLSVEDPRQPKLPGANNVSPLRQVTA